MDYRRYVKPEKLEEFEESCKTNSLDFYSCGVVLTAHMVLDELMRHERRELPEKKCSPKEAWDYSIRQTPYHSGMSASAVALTVVRFSPRGEEFKEWAKKEGGFMVKWD